MISLIIIGIALIKARSIPSWIGVFLIVGVLPLLVPVPRARRDRRPHRRGTPRCHGRRSGRADPPAGRSPRRRQPRAGTRLTCCRLPLCTDRSHREQPRRPCPLGTRGTGTCTTTPRQLDGKRLATTSPPITSSTHTEGTMHTQTPGRPPRRRRTLRTARVQPSSASSPRSARSPRAPTPPASGIPASTTRTLSSTASPSSPAPGVSADVGWRSETGQVPKVGEVFYVRGYAGLVSLPCSGAVAVLPGADAARRRRARRRQGTDLLGPHAVRHHPGAQDHEADLRQRSQRRLPHRQPRGPEVGGSAR